MRTAGGVVVSLVLVVAACGESSLEGLRARDGSVEGGGTGGLAGTGGLGGTGGFGGGSGTDGGAGSGALAGVGGTSANDASRGGTAGATGEDAGEDGAIGGSGGSGGAATGGSGGVATGGSGGAATGGSGGTLEAGKGPCVSGTTGTHAARFRWAGSGSTAYVVYEANTLPDTSPWHVSAASASVGYTPVFVDPFLGQGGLDLSGAVFIDVELSTAGLSSFRSVTIAVYGRSYNTTTSGSFSWQTLAGTGAAPAGLVSNTAPYEWYTADATPVFSPGNANVLLRLRAGPQSNALVVNRVEICFDAT